MMNTNPFYQENEVDSRVNIERIYFSLLSNWYWIALFVVFCTGLAYLYGKTTSSMFEVKSSLVVRKDDSGMDMSELFESSFGSTNTKIAEHIGIIRSFNINYQTLSNLDWKISSFEKDVFRTYDLYKDSPFIIQSSADSLNVTEVPIYITPISDTEYEVNVDAEAYINGTEQVIKVNKVAKFGEEFANNYFRFSVDKGPLYDRHIESGRSFFFKYNDIYQMTNKYIQALQIRFEDEESNVITLSLTGPHRQRSVDYLNQLSNVYIEYGLNEKNQTSRNTIDFIDTQLSGVVDSLQVAGENFTDFRSRNRIVDLSQEASMVVDKLEQIESEESTAKIQLEYYQNLSTYLGDADRMESVIAPSVVGITDQSLNSMVLKLSELYTRKNALSIVVEPRNPTLIAVENEIEYTRKSLGENLNNLISNAQVQLQAIETRKAEINSQLSRMPKTEQDMVDIKRQFDLNNELYTFLLEKRAEAAINKASNIPDVKILDIAKRDLAIKVGPKKILIYLSGLIVGFLIPALIIFMKHYFANTYDSKEDVQAATPIRILSDILQSEVGSKVPTLDHPNTGVTETFRSLRTNLKFIMKEGNKVIAIHSTGSGEGKTFISVNLAITLTMNGNKVLLIGADLRKPRLHEYIPTPSPQGLSNYLANDVSAEKVIYKTKIKNLEIIPSGSIPPNPAELLESDTFSSLIEDCKKYYDYIIIDNAPLPVVTDGILVGMHSDVNLFIYRLNFTRRHNIKYLNQIVKSETLNNIYLVLNGVKAKKFGYYRIYGQSGYYRNRKKKEKQRQKQEQQS